MWKGKPQPNDLMAETEPMQINLDTASKSTSGVLFDASKRLERCDGPPRRGSGHDEYYGQGGAPASGREGAVPSVRGAPAEEGCGAELWRGPGPGGPLRDRDPGDLGEPSALPFARSRRRLRPFPVVDARLSPKWEPPRSPGLHAEANVADALPNAEAASGPGPKNTEGHEGREER